MIGLNLLRHCVKFGVVSYARPNSERLNQVGAVEPLRAQQNSRLHRANAWLIAATSTSGTDESRDPTNSRPGQSGMKILFRRCLVIPGLEGAFAWHLEDANGISENQGFCCRYYGPFQLAIRLDPGIGIPAFPESASMKLSRIEAGSPLALSIIARFATGTIAFIPSSRFFSHIANSFGPAASIRLSISALLIPALASSLRSLLRTS